MTGAVERIIRVVGADGLPMTQAIVTVEASPEPFPEIALVSDDHGELRVVMEPGRWRLAVHTSTGQARVDVEIDPDSTSLTIVGEGGGPPADEQERS